MHNVLLDETSNDVQIVCQLLIRVFDLTVLLLSGIGQKMRRRKPPSWKSSPAPVVTLPSYLTVTRVWASGAHGSVVSSFFGVFYPHQPPPNGAMVCGVQVYLHWWPAALSVTASRGVKPHGRTHSRARPWLYCQVPRCLYVTGRNSHLPVEVHEDTEQWRGPEITRG